MLQNSRHSDHVFTSVVLFVSLVGRVGCTSDFWVENRNFLCMCFLPGLHETVATRMPDIVFVGLSFNPCNSPNRRGD